MSAVNQIEYSYSYINSFHIRYFSQLIMYQVMIFIQIVLIIVTAIKFRQNAKTKELSDDELRNTNRMKYLFFVVLFTGTAVFVLVEWYGIADFLYDFAAWTNYCPIAAILGNFSIMTYLLALFIFYLYRLHATFLNSSIGLSPFMLKALLYTTLSVYVVMIILVSVFQKGADKRIPFAWSMKKADYKPIIICEGEFSIGIDPKLRWILQAIVTVGNAFYGYIFYKKLHDLLKFMQAQKHKTETDLSRLMRKQATLVMVSTASSVIMWSITNILYYFGSFLQVLIYLDISINCFCLFLMFSWNDAFYTKLCKPCGVLDNICCSIPKHMGKEIENQLENQLDFHDYDDGTNSKVNKPNDSKPVQSADTTSIEIP